MSVEASTFGDRMADVYDELHEHLSTPQYVQPMVDLLAQLGGAGPALELGIGTGRIALPLANRGIEVHGIDASEGMLAKLREKPGGKELPVTIGDFSEVGVDGRYSLVYAVFNTFLALLTQEAQVECFRNVVHHLAADGVFLIEAAVPDPTRFTAGQNIQAGVVQNDLVSIDLERYDPLTQRVVSSHMYITESGVQMYPTALRYAWPSEIDLMAQVSGMQLRNRWSDPKGAPFTAASRSHVSTYELQHE